MKSIEELKQEFKEELEKLKAKQKAEFERVRAFERKKEALERAAARKAENHVKYLLVGGIMAEMKRTRDVSRLEALAATLVKDRDKAACRRLIEYIQGAPPAKPLPPDAPVAAASADAASLLSDDSALPPAGDAPPADGRKEKRGLFGFGG